MDYDKTLPCLLFTTAPANYDYNCNKVVVENAGTMPKSTRQDGPVRLLLCQDDYRAEYQHGRYCSGLYFSRRANESGLKDILEEIKYGYLVLSEECLQWLSDNGFFPLVDSIKTAMREEV